MIEIEGFKIFGTDFYWPMMDYSDKHFDYIPNGLDILIAHGPPDCKVSGKLGCKALR